jgi:hypothetical protein
VREKQVNKIIQQQLETACISSALLIQLYEFHFGT